MMTIVFIGFDGYSDLWSDLFSLFNHFWPDCPYKVLFVNNVIEVDYDNVQTLHAGADAEWSRKVQIALKNADSPYVCLLLEDFFIGSTIDTKLIEKTIQFINDEKIKYYKLANMSRAVKNRDACYKAREFLHVIPESDEYGISLQPAVWEKNFLSAKLGSGNYNAWKFEFDRVKEADEKSNRVNPGCVFDDRNILKLQHGVIQSMYLPGTIRYFKTKGIELNVKRKVMSWPNYFKLRLISKGKHSLPRFLRSPIKKMLEKCGMKFVSTMRK